MHKPLEIVIYGRNMIDLARGAKRIHMNTFGEHDDDAATEYAQTLARKIGEANGRGDVYADVLIRDDRGKL